MKLPGCSKVSRLDSLGKSYTLEDLLVDIQAKLHAGNGAGYVRWAKVFNLKQMASTMNFLTEHNLMEYAVLEEKKKIYVEYWRSREKTRELLAVKSNVDRLMGMDEEQAKEKERDHSQR